MYSPFSHAGSIFLKRRPIHLTLFLTRRCNSRCPFCFYLRSAGNDETVRRELTMAEIEKVSKSMGSLLWLAFSGGEIFLREDLVEISSLFYRNNRPSIMLFPTNGLLPELIRERMARILSECAESVIAVKLSLDGLDSAHDAIRNTPGSFEKSMRTYELLSPLLGSYPNFELGINTVFCSENQDAMEGIIDFVNGLEHVKTHTISLVRGDLLNPDFKEVDQSKYRRAIERLEENLKGKTSQVYRFRGARIKAAQDILQRRLIHHTMEQKRSLIPCYAGRLNLVVNESGDVFPCEILTSSMGNLKDFGYDVTKLLGSNRARRIIDSIKKRNCYCTHECYFMTNILFNPTLYPQLLREYLRIS